MIKRIFLRVKSLGPYPYKYDIVRLTVGFEVDNKMRQLYDFDISPTTDDYYSELWLKESGIELNPNKVYNYSVTKARTSLMEVMDRFINKFEKRDRAFLITYNDTKQDNLFFKSFLSGGGIYLKSYCWDSHIDLRVLATEVLKYKATQLESFKLPYIAKTFGIYNGVLENNLQELEAIYKIYHAVNAYIGTKTLE